MGARSPAMLTRRNFLRFAAALPLGTVLGSKPAVDVSKVFGRIQWVNQFPDYKVRIVDHFPDLRVQIVDAFPNEPGKWQIVASFPDFKIQIVTAFPDFKIQFTGSFPGPA